MLDMVVKISYVVFSTDMFHPRLVKAFQRRSPGGGDKLVLKGEMTKRSSDWKVCLTNDENIAADKTLTACTE